MRRMYSLNQLQEIALKKIESTTNLKVFENIVDKDGHKRFVEGNGTPLSQTGVGITYCKWSLSGTHIMIVVAGDVNNGTSFGNTALASYSIPKWILDKIYPVYADKNIEFKTLTLYGDDGTSQTIGCYSRKETNSINIQLSSSSITLTAKRGFRLEFDLLIDNE